MQDDFVRVTQRQDDMWTVLRGPRGIVLLAFKLKTHAIAYARAISFAGKLPLFVDDRCGVARRQDANTLTYPMWLD